MLRLEKTVYGTKQACKAFWNLLVRTLRSIGFTRSTADPGLFSRNDDNGVVLIATWVDDLFIMGRHDAVVEVKLKIGELMPIKECGEMREYVGCKITPLHDNSLVITHPVILQSFDDEFNINNKNSNATPAA